MSYRNMEKEKNWFMERPDFKTNWGMLLAFSITSLIGNIIANLII